MIPSTILVLTRGIFNFLSTTNLTEADVFNPCLVLNQHYTGLNSCVWSLLCKLYRAMTCSSQKRITKVDSVSRRITGYQMLGSSCCGKCPPSGLKAFSVCTNMSKHVFSSFGKQKHVDSNCSIIIFDRSPYNKKVSFCEQERKHAPDCWTIWL